MCYFQGKPVGEYCSCCQKCSSHLVVCVPYLDEYKYTVGDCDCIDFCNDYCPLYSSCEEVWGKAVSE